MRPMKPNSLFLKTPKNFSTSTQQESSIIQLIKSSSKTTKHCSQIHSHLISTSLFQNPNISLAFLSHVSNNIFYAYQVFNHLSKPTLSHYNAMIRAFSFSHCPEHGLELFREVKRNGFRPDTFSLSFVIKCCVKIRSFLSRYAHFEVSKSGLCSEFSDSLLINQKMGSVKIQSFLGGMVCCEVSENGLCSEFSDSVLMNQKMGCVKIRSFSGEQVHCEVSKSGLCSDSLLMTTLMGFYSVCGRRDDVCKVFEEIELRDTVAWNVLIDSYLRNGRTREALRVFSMMEEGECGARPDDVTCLLLLQACANLNSLEFGERVYSYAVENGYGNVTNVLNSVIAMYSRCGCVEKGYEVFKGMAKKNVVSWTAIITGLANNGYGKEAIEGFKEMRKLGVAPQEQTFTGVLSACSRSGMIGEGWKIFISMSEDFGIAPNVHHYGCMVDLLGRAGLLDQAYNLILSMRVEPDATVWRTLLGACRVHRHVTLGNRVVEHLTELKALEAGDYVLLLNIYSSIGDWEKVSEMRKLMQDKVIQTTPGCSTIELKGEVHEFLVDDISHPRKREIYDMLDEIGKQLKIAGYVAEVTSEMHNLGEREKETMLTYHSEKLAIAFGILATPPGTTIRVAKNIRTCVDCHNFAKFVSSVYNREVVIRDRTQFHHFRDGHCSCNDYW